MKIGIAIFAYSRKLHLEKVLEGLKQNERADRVYFFQDGFKCESDRQSWEEITQVIREVDWCEKKVIVSEKNKGLSQSIVDGIQTVLEENDAIIVLEDDCVPSPYFVTFMKQCFEKYEANKQIYSISGYSWPINIERDDYDVYFTGRISSWGWGTWKDRWVEYSKDNEILNRLKNSQGGSERLAAWGRDLESMFLDRVSGKNDSWAVYWALHVIEAGGMCIAPYRSLIDNIGFDGSGVHCGINSRFKVELETREKDKFLLPSECVIKQKTKNAFAPLYGSYTAVSQKEKKENVLVYGVGNFFCKNEKRLNEDYNIVAFIDKSKKGYYAGKKIIKVWEIGKFQYDKIIIMVLDVQECIKITNNLMETYGIKDNQIGLGTDLYQTKEEK